MKRIGLLLSTAFLASNIAYAESVLTREKLEATTGLSLGYNTSWSSHYVWRGESQSSKDMSPAIGADLGHSSGFYTGVWTGAITNAAIPSEFDWYFGYATDFGPISMLIGPNWVA